ncbi:branched-chain amino acid transport system substrate-binding protein [Variovorax paradoxus]|uniref:Branched-chain amino acid transport system substrate-binding protein n=1 Tax=Variovorax paradoxus TaxID=34073 RepID=A0AAE3Y3L9_VARPD|nr:ABC transporter substrate-binding protein [Variovorax paradoxus]MDP9965319.1 branched-chain amino acid transport system substrate-binding protein [Variovorax paradoxus]MDR6430014.1 branched-chain amino acid transport system substrate-binding protein [Variovorax paradoxus]MDR6456451.1 branched-chain amino acid transport system substrate-binding protein [Variovorax paradoxus]
MKKSSIPFPRAGWLGAAALVLCVPAMADALIGVSLPQTGPKALVGRNFKQGVELAVSEINAAGGVLGKPLEVVFEDDQGDNPNGAINAVNKLMQVSKVPVMIGPHYSVTQMATQKTYCNGKVVSITGGTSVAITHSGCSYVVRTRSDDDVQARALIAYARNELKAGEKTAVFYANDDFGKSGQARVVAQMAALGLKPVAVESHNPSDKDYSAQLAKLQKSGAELVILWAHDTDAALILRQARQFGLPFKFAGAVLSEDAFLKLAGSAAEGSMSASYFVPTDPNPAVQAFVKKYEARYKMAPDVWSATYYDATILAAKAINEARSADVEKIRAAFSSVNYSGLLADYKCDKAGDCNKQVNIVEIKGGQPVVRSAVRF